jgi:hypothetical protein
MNDTDRTENEHAEQSRTEKELSEALEALAGGVRAAPDAYRSARGEWLRRERRRRLVLAVMIAVVFTLATLIGLWVLNQAPSDPHVIFSGAPGTAASRGIPAVPASGGIPAVPASGGIPAVPASGGMSAVSG